MNKEEIEAIEMLDKFITEHELFNIKQADNLEGNIKIALNLIDKLQKENEKLEKNRKVSQNFAKTVERDYIDKDKIREKIKDIEENWSTVSVFEIDVLKELLGDE